MGSYDRSFSGDRLAAVGLAKRLCRVVPALRELNMRTALVRNHLEEAGIVCAAATLDIIAQQAEQTQPAAKEVIAAIVPILSDAREQSWVGSLRQTAKDHAFLSLARLLRRRGKAEEFFAEDHHGPSGGIALEPGGRPLSLGERRALARKPSRSTLDKLLSDPHPLVIQNLLVNPRLTEDDVVRMAARRPAHRDVIAEIARSPKWMTRARVRMAIVLNPASPSEISVPILSQLLRAELAEVVASTLVPVIVRATARDLLERRPPMSSDSEDDPFLQ